MSGSVSPLAPTTFATLPAVRGLRMATASAGIKYKNRTDVLMMVFDAPAAVAGVFTKSKCPSAPVDFCRQIFSHGTARAVVVNSGNANAFTGVKGRQATELTAKSAASAVGCGENEVYLASTGVIGEPLDATKFAGVLDQMQSDATGDFWFEAAKAIMTTDTYPKVATRERRDRRRLRHDQRHCQGRRDDRTRHGDDAVLRCHRRRYRALRAAGAAVGRRRSDLQFDDRRQRHVDLRHADAVCHRRHCGRRPEARRDRRPTRGLPRSARR